MRYIFDIDMTLSFVDKQMTADMADVFRKAMAGKEYYFCSGAPLEKMRWRLPADIFDNAAGVFPVMGGEFWVKDQQVYCKHFMPPNGLMQDLEDLLAKSQYPVRTGAHIEHRKAMLCFSTVGCCATLPEREAYYVWEERHQERQAIVAFLQEKYPQLSVVIGGKTSVDIAPKGCDKGQILPELRDEGVQDNFTFFGDKMDKGGIDYALRIALEDENKEYAFNNEVFAVRDPDETCVILKKMIEK